MVQGSQITPGMTLSIKKKLYRVESAVKVTVPKGTPFIKTKLKDLSSDEMLEKNFKLQQSVSDVSLIERTLEYLYEEGDEHLFLDIDDLEQLHIAQEVIGARIDYLKEGVEIQASFYGDTVFSVELPQFLELMVSATEGEDDSVPVANVTKTAILETGARIDVPPFVDSGDIIKVDTSTNEFIQRV